MMRLQYLKLEANGWQEGGYFAAKGIMWAPETNGGRDQTSTPICGQLMTNLKGRLGGRVTKYAHVGWFSKRKVKDRGMGVASWTRQAWRWKKTRLPVDDADWHLFFLLQLPCFAA
eukprot:765328-Hanusia_phi.AAC.2